MIQNAEQVIKKLIDKRSVAYISSIDNDGYPNTRSGLPPRAREGIKTFYFISDATMMRVRQYRNNPKACIYFYEKHSRRGVMLRGAMEVLEDDASKRLVWRDGDIVDYPLGPSDPSYCALRFTAQSGRFYSDLRSEDFIV